MGNDNNFREVALNCFDDFDEAFEQRMKAFDASKKVDA